MVLEVGYMGDFYLVQTCTSEMVIKLNTAKTKCDYSRQNVNMWIQLHTDVWFFKRYKVTHINANTF